MTPLDIQRLVPPPGRVFLYCPMFACAEDALSWFEAHGAKDGKISLFRGPDGSWRGCAEIEVP